MKIIILIMVVSIWKISAKDSFAQNINLQKSNAPLKEVLILIQQQTGFTIFCRSEHLQHADPVTVTLIDVPLEKALKTILAKQNLDFTIDENTVVVRKKEQSIVEKFENLFSDEVKQQDIVSGTVSDSTGAPLRGVTVKIKGTNRATFTNENGKFVLRGVDPTTVLQFNLLGYNSVEKLVDSRQTINVVLRIDIAELETVEINAGYYTVKDYQRTGSISRITAAEIEKQPVSNPLLALHGRAPGVVITQQSGVPGNAVGIQIRGQNSLRAEGNSPLYIIDGVPISSEPIFRPTGSLLSWGVDPLNTLNPKNIESIEILKDADATAIYGSRGANGVVLITTKKGRVGSPKLDLSFSSAAGRVPKKLDLLHTDQYLEMRREAFRNDGITPTLQTAPDLLAWDSARYTDWQDVFLGNTAHINDAQIALSGGSALTTFRLHGGWRNETMVFPGDMGHRLASAGLHINQRAFSNRLNITLAANYGQSHNNASTANLARTALTLAPNAPALYTEDGRLNWENSTWQNPFAQLELKSVITSENLNVNSTLSYQLLKDLYLKANMGYALNYTRMEQKEPLSSKNPTSVAQYGLTGAGVWGRDQQHNWLIEPQILYNFRLGQHQWDALLGGTFQSQTHENFILRSYGYINDALIGNTQAANQIIVTDDNLTEYRYAAAFARIGYNWNDRYFVNLTGRRDGSSRFGPARRQANFGALGAAWIISKEPFMERLPTINFLKLRGSYGTTGNDRIGDYGYLDLYDVGIYFGRTSLTPAQLYNPDFSWEVNRKLDAELEMHLWNNRLQFNVNWFRNTSSNQLVGYALPAITGFPLVQANLAATVENKGWEFILGLKDNGLSKLKWRTTINLSIPKNRLLEYPDLESSSYANTYVVGWPLNMRKRYEYVGLDENGIYQFKDINQDSRYDINDRHIFINLDRHYYGSLQQSFGLGQWSLDLLLQYVKQQGPGPLSISAAGMPGSASNQPVHVMNRWQKQGDNTHIQRFSTLSASNTAFRNAEGSDMNLEDASFIRLRSIHIRYGLPEKFQSKLGLSNCEFFVHGQNVFTLTGYDGWEPERPGSDWLPALRTYSLGIRVGI